MMRMRRTRTNKYDENGTARLLKIMMTKVGDEYGDSLKTGRKTHSREKGRLRERDRQTICFFVLLKRFTVFCRRL